MNFPCGIAFEPLTISADAPFLHHPGSMKERHVASKGKPDSFEFWMVKRLVPRPKYHSPSRILVGHQMTRRRHSCRLKLRTFATETPNRPTRAVAFSAFLNLLVGVISAFTALHNDVCMEKRKILTGSTSRAGELTETALNLFAERDFASVTIKDIARAANVNTALIYYYFKSKEDLFRATIESAVSRALENYRELREQCDDPVELIDKWFNNNVELSEPIRKLVKIMLDYSCSRISARRIEEAIVSFYQEERSILSDSIRRGIERGVFLKVDPDRLGSFVSIHLDGIMVAAMIRPDFDLEEAVADLRDILWHRLGV
ncbi:MAG: TetR/AcrR family transcriptional regulator [Proteobacteria bacterium]|nr:MAG: TetR/AcrR family transcriptional regulator [Pseudomonadota bacterium]